MTQNEIIEKINQQVIDGLETRGLKYFKPWKDVHTNEIYPIGANNRPYQGINAFLLSYIAEKNNWVNMWLTFQEVSKRGGMVNKGEKSSIAVLWRPYWEVCQPNQKITYYEKGKLPSNLAEFAKLRFSLKYILVFSISQTNLPLPVVEKPITEEVILTPHQEAEKFLKAWSTIVPLKQKGNEAFYNPMIDEITIPKFSAKSWNCADDFYKVYFHEAIHSTGHYNRINRLNTDISNISYRESYAKEELIAEIGALYLEAITGINPTADKVENSIAYIKVWISRIKEEPNLIISASSHASKALDYIFKTIK